MLKDSNPAKTETNQSLGFTKRYFTLITLLVCLIIMPIFGGFHYRSSQLIKGQLLRQAKAYFKGIVFTRHWVANQGGVYVKLRQGETLNPYLEKIPGLKTVITDQNHELYTLKNPALVTREISQLAQGDKTVQFHITSLSPLNPANAPDSFERTALIKFEAGQTEDFMFEENAAGSFFRYMAPLVTETACLQCHGAQGYKEGDIRGGISVTVPATKAIEELNFSGIYLLASTIGIITLIISLIIYISHYFIRDLKRSEQKLLNMATRDFLTNLLNRGEGFKRFREEIAKNSRTAEPLSTVLIDIDHFKRINDTYGHQAGDQVLQSFADGIVEALREYDIICRYGGEEFLIMLPSTPLAKATQIAERLRERVEKIGVPWHEGPPIRFTISLGVCQFSSNETLDELISRVDSALYTAKANGRNRVHTG